MKRYVHRLMIWESVLYLILICSVFGQALVPSSGQMIFGDDIHHQYYFFREFFNQWMRTGVFPWWNPYIFGGQPFIADPMVNIWYPLNWVYFFFPLSVAYSWHLAFHIFWACVGMARVSAVCMGQGVRKTDDGFNAAAWVSGAVFGLSGFFMARTLGGHVDVIAAASWMPWVAWAFVRILRSQGIAHSREDDKKNIAIAAVVFACQLFSGYQTMAFMTGIVVGIMALIYAIAQKRWQPIVYSLVAGVCGMALAAVHIVPVAEFFRLGIRTYTLPYSWVSYGSWTWQSVIQLLSPFFFGHPAEYAGPPPNFIEHSAFIGVCGFMLAMVGVVWGVWRLMRMRLDRVKKGTEQTLVLWVIMLVGITMFGIWVSLGPNAPIDLQYLLWKSIPTYQYLRIPPRHLILVVFGLSGLAGVGCYMLTRLMTAASWWRWIIVVVIMLEMSVFGKNFIAVRPIPEARQDASLIRLLSAHAQPYRVLQNFGVWLPQRDALEFDAVMPHGIFSATGYDTSILRSYFEYMARASGKEGREAILSHDVQVPYLTPSASEALDFLNIRYIVVPRDIDPYVGNTRYQVVYENHDLRLKVYENLTVKPRFFLKNASCGDATVSSYTPNRIGISVDASCDTVLVSSEAWYPGWQATVDGEKSSINKIHNAFRTLSVTSGKHTIIYEYQPTIFFIGGGISVITLVCIIFWTRKHHHIHM